MLDFNSHFKNLVCEDIAEKMLTPIGIAVNQTIALQNFFAAYARYVNEFLLPFLLSTTYFSNVERERLISTSPSESIASYMDLLEFITDLSNRGMWGEMRILGEFNDKEIETAIPTLLESFFSLDIGKLEELTARQAKLTELVASVYPEKIREIAPEYGFHFENGINEKVAETERFVLYKIASVSSGIAVNDNVKPILVIPPYVLGANILAFLPGDNRSYTHYYANLGIPTYIRIMKNIDETPAVQAMTGEDDTNDTRFFCETINARHSKKVTLNGYCQGGFSSVCNILSGELDGLVDALITCVAPMDGTRSKGLKFFLNSLPPRFNDLNYGTKTLANGNKVADGKLMGWVYKLKSIDHESPLVAMYRDMMMLSPNADSGKPVKISKTALALNYWLNYERSDIPLSITKMSFDSYNTPITDDGTLPVTLFGRKLNFKRMKEKGIPWLICYGKNDDLVEQATALAPLDYIDAELAAFPKGHVAIATSWSDPKSPCALHTRFGDKQYRGPVRFQMDLSEALDKEMEQKRKPAKSTKGKTNKKDKTEKSE